MTGKQRLVGNECLDVALLSAFCSRILGFDFQNRLPKTSLTDPLSRGIIFGKVTPSGAKRCVQSWLLLCAFVYS
jgi:hypothetical protein